MAELEEEKRQQPIVEYNPPMPNYQQIYGPELSQYENYMQLLQSKVDPALQEKQDRQLATGRAFWAGANMLGNVISNIMNVNAVKAGAPSADTYNGEAFNQMYNLWKDADTRLRTERKIAQDRYDAAALGLARLKGSIAEKEAAHATNVYNINNEREARAAERANKHNDTIDEINARWEGHTKAREANGGGRGSKDSGDGRMISLVSSNGRAVDIPASSKDEYNKNLARLNSIVTDFVTENPGGMFTESYMIEPGKAGYLDPKFNGPDVNKRYRTFTAKDIKDPRDVIRQYRLMDNAEFLKRLEKQFPEIDFGEEDAITQQPRQSVMNRANAVGNKFIKGETQPQTKNTTLRAPYLKQ